MRTCGDKMSTNRLFNLPIVKNPKFRFPNICLFYLPTRTHFVSFEIKTSKKRSNILFYIQNVTFGNFDEFYSKNRDFWSKIEQNRYFDPKFNKLWEFERVWKPIQGLKTFLLHLVKKRIMSKIMENSANFFGHLKNWKPQPIFNQSFWFLHQILWNHL